MNEIVFHLRMQIAALRQLLRDQSDVYTQKEIDKVLDRINALTILIEALIKND